MIKAVLTAVLLIATPVLSDGFSTQRAGMWHGVGVQVDAQDWSMELTVDVDRATVDYATTDCGGEWRYLKVADDKIVAIEDITYGEDICLDGGLVQLTDYRDDMLFYRWFDTSGAVVAGAILMQGEMREDNYDALLLLTLEAFGKGFINGGEGVTLEENKI
ncbi:MAG: hypothetical protein ACTSRN_00290 [Alphaproteobacteria bacterium]